MGLKLPKPLLKNSEIPKETLVIHVQADAKYISYLNGVFEGYEWLAVIRTIDPAKGVVEFISSPDLEKDLRQILGNLSKEMGLKILD